MENEVATHVNEAPAAAQPGGSLSGCLVWFLGGITLSFSLVLSLVLLVLLMGSVALNVYLGWQLAGLEVTVSRIATATPALVAQPDAETAPAAEVAVAPNQATVTPVVVTATPLPPAAQLQSQQATVAAIATQSSQSGKAAAFVLPTTTVTGAVAMNPAGSDAPADDGSGGISAASGGNPPPRPTGESDSRSTQPVEPDSGPENPKSELSSAAATSSNEYELIAIEGERESRPPAEHGDLNLKLRDIEPLDVDAKLIDLDGAGIDPDAPNLGKIFKPEFTGVYGIHNWDWATNGPSDFVDDGSAVLVGIKTNPGDPVLIPPKKQDIFGGKFYATLLYASEDQVTFVYARNGNVVKGYTVHYLGLQTDPNLIKLFNESEGNQLPGLTLDTPVGIATDELIVAIRDNGTFLDARSKKDWWD
ncbi:MAG: hypothetical protein D6768_05680 [Chloroflexi bacterium]|nr:MAG: hypothetical protein D6768_05680 [Chloroflexota bacterium]